jgi:hypothetical protein
MDSVNCAHAANTHILTPIVWGLVDRLLDTLQSSPATKPAAWLGKPAAG